MIKKIPWRYIPLLWYVYIWVLYGFNLSLPDWHTLIVVLYEIAISIGLLIVGLPYSLSKKDWFLVMSYLVLGGVPVGFYILVSL